MHPRKGRSAPQLSAGLSVLQVRACFVLISRIAAQAFPGPITPAQRAHVVVGFQSWRPRRADVMPDAIHWHVLFSSRTRREQLFSFSLGLDACTYCWRESRETGGMRNVRSYGPCLGAGERDRLVLCDGNRAANGSWSPGRDDSDFGIDTQTPGHTCPKMLHPPGSSHSSSFVLPPVSCRRTHADGVAMIRLPPKLP